jgi:3'-phosphoadenosine 5'-phosphosulfate sulfotransferase (PAPS reductase)/FAD synthetase
MPPSAYDYSSNVIQFANQGMVEASFTFVHPEALLQVVAYNGGSASTVTVTLSCAGLPSASASVAPGKVVTIKTGWGTGLHHANTPQSKWMEHALWGLPATT